MDRTLERIMESTGVVSIDFADYPTSVARALDEVGAHDILARQERVLVKPNLINASPPPVTTPVECCEAVLNYVRGCGPAEVLIAEGTGDAHLETDDVFETLGYSALAKRLGVRLVDLNHEDTVALKNGKCRVFPTFHMPRIAMECYIVSVPVLKAHSIADITGSMKNMMGLAVPRHYQAGGWKKSAFHRHMHEALLDLNRHRRPELTLMDATVGLAEYHLGGRRCDPPVNRLLAGYDAQQVDREAARLLGMDWKSIPHLSDEL
jgi:uncharacterized protein (DUF362 family)